MARNSAMKSRETGEENVYKYHYGKWIKIGTLKTEK